MKQNELINSLAKIIIKLPGIGPRSAKKIALFLLSKREQVLIPMIDSLKAASERIIICKVCGNFDEVTPCNVCKSNNKEKILCIIRDHNDLESIQNTKVFNGKYQIIGNDFSPSARHAQDMINHIKKRVIDEDFDEILIALHPSVEGRMLLHYIAISLENLNKKITHLGVGIAIGSDFDYVDSETMAAAFISRKVV